MAKRWPQIAAAEGGGECAPWHVCVCVWVIYVYLCVCALTLAGQHEKVKQHEIPLSEWIAIHNCRPCWRPFPCLCVCVCAGVCECVGVCVFVNNNYAWARAGSKIRNRVDC